MVASGHKKVYAVRNKTDARLEGTNITVEAAVKDIHKPHTSWLGRLKYCLDTMSDRLAQN